jgi:hypothetical protein
VSPDFAGSHVPVDCRRLTARQRGKPQRGDYASIGGGVDHEYHFRSCPDLHRYSHDLVREAFGWRVSSVVQEGLDHRAALRDGGHGFVRHGRRGYHCKHLRPPQLAASFIRTLALMTPPAERLHAGAGINAAADLLTNR